MMKPNIKKLEKQIKQANDDYYNKTPTMSDAEYDTLKDALAKADPDNKLLKEIGAKVQKSSPLQKVTHEIPMGSLNKVTSYLELDDWKNKVEHLEDVHGSEDVVVQHKMDGMSVEILYENSVFKQAISRGDGETGEDITHNIQNSMSVPSGLAADFTGSLRGEIVIHTSDFAMHFIGEYSNPRNATAGVARSLDTKLSKYLNVYFFDCLSPEHRFSTEVEKIAFIEQELGLKTVPTTLVKDITKLEKIFTQEYARKLRDKIDYCIDGLVVKFNSLKIQEKAGDLYTHPKAQIACKFPPEVGESKVIGITHEMGLTGRITPVAHIEGIRLGGVFIEKMTLHNYKLAQEIGIGIGARVSICRRGDVIPAIESVLEPGTSTIQPPTECPICNARAQKQGEFLVCPNLECPAKVAGDIEKWITITSMDGVGPEFIQAAIDQDLIKTPADLYKLTEEDMLKLPGFAESKAKNYVAAISKTKSLTFPIFMAALNIPSASVSTFESIEKAGWSLGDMAEAKVEKLSTIHGIGEKTAQAIVDGVSRKLTIIRDLLRNGVEITQKSTGKLTGMSFCFTGEICIKRELAQKLVRDSGGDVKTSVSKGLTYLVQADPSSQSTKSRKAVQYGTKIMGEDEFLDLVEFDLAKLEA